MRVTIVVPDLAVGVDGRFVKLPKVADLAPVHAVQFDSDAGIGHVEYAVSFSDDGLHEKPANEGITTDQFRERFGAIMDGYASAVVEDDGRRRVALEADARAAEERTAAERAREQRLAELEAKQAAAEARLAALTAALEAAATHPGS